MKVFVISSLLVCLLAVGCDHFSPLSKGEYAFNVNGDDGFVMELSGDSPRMNFERGG